MKSETSIKSTRRIACELCFLALAVLLEVSFFSEISAFLNSLIQRAGFDGGFSLFIATIYFYAPIILAPFVLLSLRYDTFLSRIAVISPAEGLIRNLFLINVGAALFCSFFWVIKARGILEAVRYESVNFNFILLGAVILLSYAAANSNLKSTKNLANGLKYSFVICFCYVFYHWFGLDDGCVTTGADPIFGGGGQTDCDPDFVKKRDSLNDSGTVEGFNVNAAFAVKYLWMTTASFLTITVVYILKLGQRRV